MNEVDKIEFQRIYDLTVAKMQDKHSAQDLIQKYIDAGAKYCMTCDPAIRAMFRRLKAWWDENKDKV
jgi:hypothetical protein